MNIDTFVESNLERFTQELIAFLKIQSISTDKSHAPDIQAAAKWVEDKYLSIGLDSVTQLQKEDGNPVVYGEKIIDPALPTLLVYGHYDVQPAGDSSSWETPAFEPVVREGALFGRGATDDKGQFLTNLFALEYYLKHATSHPWNIKVVAEGEEEIGGHTIDAMVQDSTFEKFFKAEYAYISDGPWAKMGVPSIEFSLRGLAYYDLELVTSKAEMHSGLYGNVVLNPANLAGYVINKLKNILTNRIRIPNIYKQVRKINDEEATLIDRGTNTWEEIIEHTGALVTTPIRKRSKEFSPAVWTGVKPSLDVHGIQSGFTEKGQVKTVIPNYALIKFSLRLVPFMNPAEVRKNIEKYLSKIIPKGVTYTLTELNQNAAYIADPQDSFVKKLMKAYEFGYGKTPALVPSGGSIGLVTTLFETLGVKSLLASYGLPDDRLHGPNEKFALSQYKGGAKTFAAFLTDAPSKS